MLDANVGMGVKAMDSVRHDAGDLLWNGRVREGGRKTGEGGTLHQPFLTLTIHPL